MLSEEDTVGSRGVDEPGAAFNPTDKGRAFLKATCTSGHQASFIESFDCGGEGGINGCEGLTRKSEEVG